MLQRNIPPGKWDTRRQEKKRRTDRLGIAGKVLPRDDLPAMLEKLIAPGDRVVLRAEIDAFVGISACSVQESACNDGECSAIKVYVED